MVSLRLPLLSAVIALLLSVSAALSMLSPLRTFHPSDPIDRTNTSIQAPSRQPQNLTFAPWPARPFQVSLHARFAIPDLVIITATSFHGTRPVSVPDIQAFLHEFGDNLERKYPTPGRVPRKARQSIYDVESYTKWMIEFNEGLWGYELPTEWALLALKEIARQLGRYGPADLFFSVKEQARTYTYGFLEIREFGGLSRNTSLADGKSNYQTV